MTEKPNLIIYR